MKYHFIVNPKARSGLGEMIWRRLEPELIKRRTDYQCCLTTKRKEAGRIASDITSDGKPHTLVVLGGDGTLNEVINGITCPEETTLGYIPIGSSNDFARGLGLPKDPERAMEMILRPAGIRKIDIGEVTGGNRSSRFLVSAGIGFDAAVCHEVCVSKWKVFLNRIGLGKLSYAVVALDRLKKDRPVTMRLTLPDGTAKILERTYFTAFMNLPYEGGGFKFTPEADPGDGMLDVISAHGIGIPKVLFLLPLALMGKHTGFKGISLIKCREVRVQAERALPLHTDGEPGFLRRDIRVRLTGSRLNVIVK